MGTGEGPVTRKGVDFVPDQSGLAVAGQATRVDFGRAPSGVIAVMDRELGRGRNVTPSGCALREMAWGDLTLSFTSERFVGWQQAGAKTGQTCA